MPRRTARRSQAGDAAVRIEPLAPSDYDGLVALWKASGLTYRPRGRDSRRAITAQLKRPTAIYLKAVVSEGFGHRGSGIGSTRGKAGNLRFQSPDTRYRKPDTPGQTGRLVGAVLGSHDGRRGWINRLAVMPGRQRKGVGGALVKELERRLDRLGLLLVAVQVDKGNRRSLRFFKDLGYRLHDDIHYLSKRKGDWA